MDAPSAAELLKSLLVQQALEDAWQRSLPHDPDRRYEEGGWIYADVNTGAITAVSFASPGGQTAVDLGDPPAMAGAAVVATFILIPIQPRRAGIQVQAKTMKPPPGSSVSLA